MSKHRSSLLVMESEPPPQAVALRPVWLERAEWQRWDAFCHSHPEGMVYHRSEWLTALEESFPHMRGSILTLQQETDGRIVGGIPVSEVRSWLLGNRLVSVPFSSVFDPLARTTEELALLMEALRARAEKIRANSVELRLWRAASQVPHLRNRVAAGAFKHHHLDLTQGIDRIWEGCAQTSIRQRITRAQRSGFRVERVDPTSGLAAFHGFVEDLRRRLVLPPIPRRFFESLARCLGPERFRLHLAYRDGECVGCFLGLVEGSTYIFEYSADAPDHRKDGINQFLYWHGIQEACELGCSVFSFGRTASDNEGLLGYKRRWGSVEADLAVYSWPGSEPKSTEALTSRARGALETLIRISPGPLYRLIGKMVYRHWG